MPISRDPRPLKIVKVLFHAFSIQSEFHVSTFKRSEVMALRSSGTRNTADFAKVTITKARYTSSSLFLIYWCCAVHVHVISLLVVNYFERANLIT